MSTVTESNNLIGVEHDAGLTSVPPSNSSASATDAKIAPESTFDRDALIMKVFRELLTSLNQTQASNQDREYVYSRLLTAMVVEGFTDDGSYAHKNFLPSVYSEFKEYGFW